MSYREAVVGSCELELHANRLVADGKLAETFVGCHGEDVKEQSEEEGRGKTRRGEKSDSLPP